MNTIDLLRELSEATGVSGCEAQVTDIVSAHFRPYTDHVTVDNMGNVIALRRGTSVREPRPRIMLAAHMDEIGLIVTKLDKGFIRFSTVGGFDVRVLPGQQVVVHGDRALPGVVGAPPPHVTSPEDRRKVLKTEDLFIDVGLPEAELADVVHVGDFISIDRELQVLGNGIVSGKALDDRAGVAVVILTFELLSKQTHGWDVFGVATVQEEVGLRGARTSAFDINPDVAVAIDVGFALAPGVDPADAATMGKGPIIGCGPNIHPVLFEHLIEAAKRWELPHQVQAEPGESGTDAWAIQVARGGVPTAIVSIPLRYMHTSVETVAKTDIERGARLLAAFISSLSDEFVEELVPSA